MRNIGGSIGISIVVALLTENTQIVHSRLVEHLRPDNPLAHAPLLPSLQPDKPVRHAALNAEATRQAAMVAYINDFKLMMLLVILRRRCCCCCAGRPTGRSKPQAIAQSNHARSIASPILQIAAVARVEAVAAIV